MTTTAVDSAVRPAFSPVSACGHGCLPRPGTTPAVGWPLRTFRLVALVLALLGGVLVALATPVLSRAGRAAAKRGWFKAVLRASGVRLRVVGSVSAGGSLAAGGTTGTLVAANHVSWLDIPAVLAVEPVRVVAKSDVRGWPVIGMLAARGGTVFIDRNRLRRLPVTVAEIADLLRSGQNVLVFPEGSTWCGRTQGRFYPAAFQAAIDAQAPVRPVSLRYRLADGTPTTIAAFVGDDSLIASVMRVVSTRGLVAELVVGPIDVTATEPPPVRKAMAARAATLIRGSALPEAAAG
jgi:1-acyl-sn-glycerol-3-phosphate acyltransferase